MKTVITLFLVTIYITAFSQKKATDEDGKAVILNRDGTWEYLEIEKLPTKGDCKFDTNEVDEFTGNQTVVLSPLRIAKNLLATPLRVADSEALFLKYHFDIGCLSDEAYAIFKFIDDSTLKIHHDGDIDCGSGVTFISYLLDNDALNILSSKPIAKVRLVYSEGGADLDITDSNALIDGLNCVLK